MRLCLCACVCVCECVFVLSANHPSLYPASSARPSPLVSSPWLLQHHAPVLSDVHAGLPDRQHRHGGVKLELQLAFLAAWERRRGREGRPFNRGSTKTLPTGPHLTPQLLQKYTWRDEALPCTGVLRLLTAECSGATLH